MSESKVVQAVPSGQYDQGLLDALVAHFQDPYAAWVLLSTEHYNWCAHTEVASALTLACPDDADQGDQAAHLRQHLGMAVVEQVFEQQDLFWRLVAGYQSHQQSRGFLPGYCGKLTKAKIESLLTASTQDWLNLLPHSYFTPPSDWKRFSEPYVGRLANACMHIASEVQQGHAVAEVVDQGETIKSMSLRDGNSVYRQGTRALYMECLPAEAAEYHHLDVARSFDPRAILLLDHRRRSGADHVYTGRLSVDRAALARMVETIHKIGTTILAMVTVALAEGMTEPVQTMMGSGRQVT